MPLAAATLHQHNATSEDAMAAWACCALLSDYNWVRALLLSSMILDLVHKVVRLQASCAHLCSPAAVYGRQNCLWLDAPARHHPGLNQ